MNDLAWKHWHQWVVTPRVVRSKLAPNTTTTRLRTEGSDSCDFRLGWQVGRQAGGQAGGHRFRQIGHHGNQICVAHLRNLRKRDL